MIRSIALLLVQRERRHLAKRTLLRAGLCLCTLSLVAIQALLAQVPSSQTLTAPAITSGTYGYMASSDITASSTFTVSGTASVIFTAGQTIHLEDGFRATAGSAGITFDALIGPTNPSGPIINNLLPSTGAVNTQVTINGSNFGTSGTVTFFSGVTVSYTNSNGSSITLLVPNGTVTGPVVVTVAGVTSNAVNFTVTAGNSTAIREYIRLGGRVIAIEVH